MAYNLIDKNGNDVTHHDLQDKGAWCEIGVAKEEAFVNKFGDQLGLIINPDKENNPFAPDLINIKNNALGDLKTQNTPFFKANSLYGLNPQYTVVFNEKDRVRYAANYPNIEIYFAVDWVVTEFRQNGNNIMVKPMFGIWRIPFLSLLEVIKKTSLHEYIQRQGDTRGNAKASYVLTLEDFHFEQIL